MANLSKKWGMAWVALVFALFLHVIDEVLTDFLPFYNSVALSVRDSYPWLPLPTSNAVSVVFSRHPDDR